MPSLLRKGFLYIRPGPEDHISWDGGMATTTFTIGSFNTKGKCGSMWNKRGDFMLNMNFQLLGKKISKSMKNLLNMEKVRMKHPPGPPGPPVPPPYPVLLL